MGVTTSAASLPSEAAAPYDPPAKEVAPPAATADAGPQAAAAADPPAKEDIHHGAGADAPPPESAAPADSPSKGEIQSSAPAPAPGGEAEAPGETVVLDGAAAAETSEEEEGECGFCLYMKGGGCKEEFVEWEKCIEAAEAEGESVDIVDRCASVTTALRACMGKFPDYYEAILSVERAMSDDLDSAAKAEAEAGQAALAEGEHGDNKKQPEEEVVIVVEEKEDPAA